MSHRRRLVKRRMIKPPEVLSAIGILDGRIHAKQGPSMQEAVSVTDWRVATSLNLDHDLKR